LRVTRRPDRSRLIGVPGRTAPASFVRFDRASFARARLVGFDPVGRGCLPVERRLPFLVFVAMSLP
jgi:hypothetical protein